MNSLSSLVKHMMCSRLHFQKGIHLILFSYNTILKRVCWRCRRSVGHTHTLTQCGCVFVCMCASVFVCMCVFVFVCERMCLFGDAGDQSDALRETASDTHTHTHKLTHPHTPTHTPTHPHTHSHSLTHTLSLSHTHTHTHSHTHTLSECVCVCMSVFVCVCVSVFGRRRRSVGCASRDCLRHREGP